MASIKYDGVIEAVRYNPEGKVTLARAYERRGPAFSDRILLSRIDLIKRLEAGDRIVVGKRLLNKGGTFEVAAAVRLVRQSGGTWICTGKTCDHDHLEGAPLF